MVLIDSYEKELKERGDEKALISSQRSEYRNAQTIFTVTVFTTFSEVDRNQNTSVFRPVDRRDLV